MSDFTGMVACLGRVLRAGCGWVAPFLVFSLPVRLVMGESSCARIVSLAPSITEVLFEVGLGSNLVGVTSFCRYPPAAQAVRPIGGLYDMNIEEILSRKPDRVFALPEHRTTTDALTRLGIRVVEVNHATVTGIKESIRRIGEECGVTAMATDKIRMLEEQEQKVRSECMQRRGDSTARPKRVMVVVGRSREGSSQSGIYISGKDGFYAEALRLVGAENVNTQSTVSVPSVSAEGIRALRPDVIIEVVNVDDAEHPERLRAFWQQFPDLPAVAQGAVFLLSDDYVSIPGPRYIKVVSRFAQLLECGPSGPLPG